MDWWDLLWSRPTSVAATVGLVIAGLVGNSDRPWIWILGFAIFAVTHEIVNFRRKRHISNRLGRKYEIVQRRMLRLISDLSELTAREFDLWVVDLYLPPSSFNPSARSRVVVKLTRELSLALTDARAVPPDIESDHALFGRCFLEPCPGLWWDVDLKMSSSGENLWHKFPEEVNSQLQETYGVISVNPVVDDLGKGCRGLLVVHTKRDSEIATKALGVLAEPKGIRRLAEACHDIHREIVT